jgi:hypothetical protein
MKIIITKFDAGEIGTKHEIGSSTFNFKFYDNNDNPIPIQANIEEIKSMLDWAETVINVNAK